MAEPRTIFSCEGPHSVAADGAVLCQGTWHAAATPTAFSIQNLTPEQQLQLGSAFGAGFGLVAGVFAFCYLLKLLLNLMKPKVIQE